MSPPPTDPYTHGPWTIVFGLLLGASAMGFFTGTAPHKESPRQAIEDEVVDMTLEPRPTAEASSYVETRRSKDGDWSTLHGVLEAIGEQELPEVDRRQDLTERRSRRAYSGAPPRIPHGLDLEEDGACLACHREGIRVGSKTASPLPHAELQLCTQCHVPTQDLVPGGDSLEPGLHALSNTFEGLQEPEQGARSWTTAPPQVPHTSWMREKCISCHGPSGVEPLQTSHPERVNCVQCHALDDAMDQEDVR